MSRAADVRPRSSGGISADDLEFVILAAGKSTRNYPHSKGLPHKSLLPLGSVKIIDRIMREPIEAGVKNITIVVSAPEAKEAFEYAFAREPRIEDKFEKSGNKVGLELLKSLALPDDVRVRYVIQKEAKGAGHAIGLAAAANPGRHLVVRYPDDILGSRHVRRNIKPFVSRLIEKYIADGAGGNLFAVRKVADPSRWGIIEDGRFFEKPARTKSRDASVVACIFDKGFAGVLAAAAACSDKKGTEESRAWESGRELHFAGYINDFIDANPGMEIRTFPLGRDDIYHDGGTLEGYEEAIIYTLLHESRFARHNRKVAKAQFGLRKWLSQYGPLRRH